MRNGSNRSKENLPKKRSLRSVPTATGTNVKTTDTNAAAFGGTYIEHESPARIENYLDSERGFIVLRLFILQK